jgi:hypothetical protein
VEVIDTVTNGELTNTACRSGVYSGAGQMRCARYRYRAQLPYSCPIFIRHIRAAFAVTCVVLVHGLVTRSCALQSAVA